MGLQPFRYGNPDAGGGRIRFDSRDSALTAVFAALDAMINLAQSLLLSEIFQSTDLYNCAS